jgi:hypothetical protein
MSLEPKTWETQTSLKTHFKPCIDQVSKNKIKEKNQVH